MQYDMPGCSGYRRTTGVDVLDDPGSRLVFSAGEPDLVVELLQQLLVAEVGCH